MQTRPSIGSRILDLNFAEVLATSPGQLPCLTRPLRTPWASGQCLEHHGIPIIPWCLHIIETPKVVWTSLYTLPLLDQNGTF